MAKAKQHDDSRQKHLTFKPGDLVHIYWPEVGEGKAKKLLPRWRGPFKVISQISAVVYRVGNDTQSLPVLVQRLKAFLPYCPQKRSLIKLLQHRGVLLHPPCVCSQPKD